MIYSTESRYSREATGIRLGLGHLLLFVPGIVNLWYDRSRQRRSLARLDDRLLRDIGVDQASAAEEATKPFWKA